jgi:hypothetical protein
MLRHKPSYYRSRDPVHNLKIKVSIRKISTVHTNTGGAVIVDPDEEEEKDSSSSSEDDDEEEEGNSSDEEDVRAKKKKEREKAKKKAAKKQKKKKEKERKRKKKEEQEKKNGNKTDPDIGAAPWEAVFSWQEKEFSPREILLYRPAEQDEDEATAAARRKRRKRSNIVERGYEHELATGPEHDRQVKNITCHLFTYTDKDGFVPEQSYAPATGSANGIMHVGQALVDLPRRNEKKGKKDTTDNNKFSHDPVTARLRRENNCKTMYIMAAVDVDDDTLKQTNPDFFEVPLCAIRYYESGRLLEITPPLAQPVYTGGGGVTYPSTADPSVAGSLPPGVIGTYRFQSKAKAQYEYTLSNASEVTNREVAEELKKVEMEEVRRELSELANRIGSRFDRGAESDDQLRLFAYCEIVSAQKFDSDRLYVQYQFALPVQGGWSWPPEWDKYETERRRSGSTQVSHIGYTGGVSDAAAQDGTSIVYPVANFGYPFELQCIATEKKGMDVMMTGDWPQLFVEVGSCGCWGRHYVEGYGYASIPRRPGTYDLTINTWKPRGSIRDRMSDFFLGGARHLSDHVNYSAHPNPADRGPFLNKYGFVTESSGQVRDELCIDGQGRTTTWPWKCYVVVVVVVVVKVYADFSSFLCSILSCSILSLKKKKKRYAFVSMLSCKEKKHRNQKMPKLLKLKAKKNAR